MVRIWTDVHVRKLDDRHLLGEHAELHAIWSVIINEKKGYSKHPEVLRFKSLNGLVYLFQRHDEQVDELKRRGFKHLSPLTVKGAKIVHMVSHDGYSIPKSVLGNDLLDLINRNGLSGNY